MGWQRPDLEIGRARFLAVTARVNWYRSRLGRARIAGGATDKVARMPGKRFDKLHQCRKGKRTKRASREKKLRLSALARLDVTHRSAAGSEAPRRFGFSATSHAGGCRKSHTVLKRNPKRETIARLADSQLRGRYWTPFTKSVGTPALARISSSSMNRPIDRASCGA